MSQTLYGHIGPELVDETVQKIVNLFGTHSSKDESNFGLQQQVRFHLQDLLTQQDAVRHASQLEREKAAAARIAQVQHSCERRLKFMEHVCQEKLKTAAHCQVGVEERKAPKQRLYEGQPTDLSEPAAIQTPEQDNSLALRVEPALPAKQKGPINAGRPYCRPEPDSLPPNVEAPSPEPKAPAGSPGGAPEGSPGGAPGGLVMQRIRAFAKAFPSSLG
mmetsp:Transcript_90146/g.160542  ORF Transcript_90146/g.160542 Transcript_90146/m.160542 type:complete len:218 (-) Transcript_90146:92-745(-)|eukprot:CAMPEP_0197621746 /NCGR_PEP_ID=MMETSP1338-20131121/2227_1 /TAXON_ID=43686 ORGANISM="Pelagodinium beii, Strain RCC1491" /NCGR_SAMPLE_ID=MMETSP1338 /ASSEMBLY_ACC=CAM_ASM_000754 /LENGTH=217 /DNA_ID=CAMNT_0043191283 /DNA_START=45 /DNA_END=698 /DNA_ORIENTATION=+